MSKKHARNTGRFAYVPKENAPKLCAIKTEWDLKGLYYGSERDPQIERDIAKTERAYRAFGKNHRNTNFTRSPESLLSALRDLEKLAAMPERSKPGRYFGFRQVLNAKDQTAEKQATLIAERLRKAANEILFFEIELGNLSVKKQRTLLDDPKLKKYRYYLERVFLEAKHMLSEPEERIMNLKSGPAYGMWVAATDKIVSNRTIEYKKRTIPVNEALELINSVPSKEKSALWNRIMDEMATIGEFAENEFTAILNDVKIEDELRGYAKPYCEAVIAHEDNEESVEALLAAVRSEGFALSKRFYKLKARYHGVPSIHYAQKYDEIGATPKIPFAEAVEICRDVFYGVKNEYGEIFDAMLTNGQLDVYPRAGKRGGAFMSDSVAHPTHVFLNHTNTFKSLETLAHEMGHAIHAQRSKQLPVFYQGHSITTAETASTLFENLVFDAVLAQASEKQKRVLLHDKITRDIATIERQIAFFDAELAMHEHVRTQGAISNAELRDIFTAHLRKYLGPGVSVTEKDGYSYVYVSHFRYGFYVYTYTFGQLMSSLMAKRYKEDPSYIAEIDTFLSSGKRDTVEHIFREIGIETNRPDTFTEALKDHETDINAFAKLTRSAGK